MKILSWNIRGSRSPDKRSAIKALIGKETPDLVVLQEVKRESVNRGFIGSIWSSRFKEWILLPAGGILVIWDSRRLKVSENLVGEFSDSGGLPEFTALVRTRIDAVFGMRFRGCSLFVEIFGALRVTLTSLDSNKNIRGLLLRGEV